MTTCEYAHDDGAYVLGALSPAERSAFEEHLASCPACRDAVANLAVLPGLLGRLTIATVESMDRPELTTNASAALDGAATSARLTRALAAAAGERRLAQRHHRRRRLVWAAASALLMVVVSGGVGVGVYRADRPGPVTPLPMTAMRPATANNVPVDADLALVPTDGGTRVVMTCSYASDYRSAWVVRLVVFARAGGPPEPLGTWRAQGGDTINLNALTHLTPAEIGRVELQRGDGSTLLWWTPA